MVTRVTETEFELDDGRVYQHPFELNNAAINLKNLAAKLPRVPRKVTPVESDIRPTAASLATSLKQEPSTDSHSRFW